jgi:hypothetical protein
MFIFDTSGSRRAELPARTALKKVDDLRNLSGLKVKDFRRKCNLNDMFLRSSSYIAQRKRARGPLRKLEGSTATAWQREPHRSTSAAPTSPRNN